MREVVCGDALVELSSFAGVGAIVTSLPDPDEIGLEVAAWAAWAARAVEGCVAACAADAPLVFYQTDRLADGVWHDKAAAIWLAVRGDGFGGRPLCWHKIVLRRPIGSVDLFRPTYAHLLAFGGAGVGPGRRTPDVIEAGFALYENGTPVNVAEIAVRYCREQGVTIVVDPFCGYGTIPAVAEALGLRAIGIDIDPDMCEHARTVRLRKAS